MALTLVNKTDTEASIHWHGIELESYNDGVAGWSGDTRQTTKPIPPGGTLYVWFTPPRAGTFIYHTHAHGPHQLSSGMYSALLVVPDRKKFDADTDKVLLLGGSGPASAGFSGAPLELNRSTNPAPITLKVGTAVPVPPDRHQPERHGNRVDAGRQRVGSVAGGVEGRRGAAAHSGHDTRRQPADLGWRDVRLRIPAHRAGGAADRSAGSRFRHADDRARQRHEVTRRRL